ncbi:MAG: hypothetical protein LBB75_09990 [Oscillospiraceae bacterium]|jgi:hypothetical protein|nr:hypothetical protein [Oscillospiraceae bacterium]
MKKLIALFLACAFALALAACGGGPPTPTGNGSTQPTARPDPGATQDIYFAPGGVRLEIGAPPAPALEALEGVFGEPLDERDCPSCALQAKDIDYRYDGFVLTVTYPEKGDDYITGIKFTGDKYATPGGITIGSTPEEVFAAYGTDYRENNGHYYYAKELSVLHFAIVNGKVKQIAYEYDWDNA